MLLELVMALFIMNNVDALIVIVITFFLASSSIYLARNEANYQKGKEIALKRRNEKEEDFFKQLDKCECEVLLSPIS